MPEKVTPEYADAFRLADHLSLPISGRDPYLPDKVFTGEFSITRHVDHWGGYGQGTPANYYLKMYVHHPLKGAVEIRAVWNEGLQGEPMRFYPTGMPGHWDEARGRRITHVDTLDEAVAWAMKHLNEHEPHPDISRVYRELYIDRPLWKLARDSWAVRARLCREARAARLGGAS